MSMDDFSLYQWLVLGLLSVIAILLWAIATGLDRSLEAMTQRIELALADVHDEIGNLALEIHRPKHIEEIIGEIEQDSNGS
ncbi:MAG: hypothetical protein ISR48_06485 [Alphaproteobacteria bacterium]|nr:hypothetical protein [Alphaproteobacteria bacterium]